MVLVAFVPPIGGIALIACGFVDETYEVSVAGIADTYVDV
jgi:hypothetical protein